MMDETNKIPDIYSELSQLRKELGKSEHNEVEKKLKGFYEYLKSERFFINKFKVIMVYYT